MTMLPSFFGGNMTLGRSPILLFNSRPDGNLVLLKNIAFPNQCYIFYSIGSSSFSLYVCFWPYPAVDPSITGRRCRKIANFHDGPDPTRTRLSNISRFSQSIQYLRLATVKTRQLTDSVGHSQSEPRQLLSQRDISRSFRCSERASVVKATTLIQSNPMQCNHGKPSCVVQAATHYGTRSCSAFICAIAAPYTRTLRSPFCWPACRL